MSEPTGLRIPRSALIAAALGAPLVTCAILSTIRDSVTPVTQALTLVLIVVAVAATGDRIAGILATLSSAAWFDFFLTEPYHRFTIRDADDVEAAALLLLIGFAVNELALWGLRQQAQASQRAGYLDGVVGTAEIIAAGQETREVLTERICRQIRGVLDVETCHYVAGPPHDPRIAVIEHDGSLTRHGQALPVESDGLPTDMETAIPVRHQGQIMGHFRVISAARISRPTREQCRVAVLLADQAAAIDARRGG
ncbi:MAG: DUF4118 domain-containing protein [Nocardioidaceae bacterium]